MEGVERVDMVGVFDFFPIMILILYVQISYPPRVKVELLNKGEIQPVTNTSGWNTLSNVLRRFGFQSGFELLTERPEGYPD